MKLTSHEVLYQYQLKDLVSMENQIENALSSMQEAANDQSLKDAFEEHLSQTQDQLKKVQSLLDATGKTARGRKCRGIEGILEEGAEAASSTGSEDDIKDTALIAAARRVEHYEAAAYGSARDCARILGLDDDVRTLESIMQEEIEADRKLARINAKINPTADQDAAEGSEPSTGSGIFTRSSTVNNQYDNRYDNENRGYNSYSSQGYNDQGYQGRAMGGHHSAQMQGRDEQGQFTGYQGSHQGQYSQGNQGGYSDYDSNRGRYQQGGYSQGGNYGGYNQGQSMGGQHSSQMQNRDEQGRFTGYQGSNQGNYGGGNYGGGNYGGGNYGGGYSSGGYNQGGYQGQGGISDSAGRHYSQQSWEAAQQGRSLGGQHSHGGYGGGGNYGGQQGGYGNQGNYGNQGGQYGNSGNYGNQGGGYNQGGYQGQGGITDSAGRHYSQESWDAAQRGRSLGGQHSHSGQYQTSGR